MKNGIHNRIVPSARPSAKRYLTGKPSRRGSGAIRLLAGIPTTPGATCAMIAAIFLESPPRTARYLTDSGSALIKYERNQKGQDSAKIKNRSPAPRGNHRRAGQPAQESAQRHPDEKCGNEDSLQTLRRVFGGKRNDVGHRASQPESR